MPWRYLDKSEKYALGGSRDEVIGLPVFLTDLPPSIEVNGYTLLLKDEFHVSLVCMEKIIEKQGVPIPNFISEVTADFSAFAPENPIELLRYRNEFRFVEDKGRERKSVIVMCDVSNLGKFFDFFNEKYGLKLEYPPTHVTLYTLQPNKGIYLVDEEDMKKKTVIMQNPIGRVL